MGLKEEALQKLVGEEETDFSQFCRYEYGELVMEFLPSSHSLGKKMYILYLKIGDQETPFASVKITERFIRDRYEPNVQIPLDMVPSALEAIAMHLQTDKYINDPNLNDNGRVQNKNVLQAVRDELNILLKSPILENKETGLYREVV